MTDKYEYEIVTYSKADQEQRFISCRGRKSAFKKARELKATGEYEMVIVQELNGEECTDDWAV